MPLELRDAIDQKAGEGGRSKWIIDQCYKGLGINPDGPAKAARTSAQRPAGPKTVNPRPKGK